MIKHCQNMQLSEFNESEALEIAKIKGEEDAKKMLERVWLTESYKNYPILKPRFSDIFDDFKENYPVAF